MSPDARTNECIIINDISVGPLYINKSNVSDVKSWLGEPDAINDVNGGKMYTYKTYKIGVSFYPSWIVRSIVVSNPAFYNQDNIKIGTSTIIDVTQRYSEAKLDKEFKAFMVGYSTVFVYNGEYIIETIMIGK